PPSRCSPLHAFVLTRRPATEPYTLSLHDALPIFGREAVLVQQRVGVDGGAARRDEARDIDVELAREPNRVWQREIEHVELHRDRSEEHTSELQSRENLVCRLLLEKKKDSQAAPGE